MLILVTENIASVLAYMQHVEGMSLIASHPNFLCWQAGSSAAVEGIPGFIGTVQVR